MALMQFINWGRVLYQSRAVKTIGIVLIPILDAVSTPSMIGFTGVIIVCLVAFAVSCSVVMKEYTLKEMVLRSYYFLVIAEPELFDATNYEDPLWRYAVVLFTFFCFTVLLMNVFIAITSESYQSRRKLVEGSFLVERKGLCEKAFLLRKLMFRISKTCRCLSSRRRWLVLGAVLFAALFCILLFCMDDSRGRLCALQFVAISFAIFIAKVIAIWWGRGEAKRGNTHNSNFLWVCVPKDCVPFLRRASLSSAKEGKHTVRFSGDATTEQLFEIHELLQAQGKKQKELEENAVGAHEELRSNVSKVEQKQEELQKSLVDVVKQLQQISEKLGCSQQPQSPNSTASSKPAEVRGARLSVSLPVDHRGHRSYAHAASLPPEDYKTNDQFTIDESASHNEEKAKTAANRTGNVGLAPPLPPPSVPLPDDAATLGVNGTIFVSQSPDSLSTSQPLKGKYPVDPDMGIRVVQATSPELTPELTTLTTSQRALLELPLTTRSFDVSESGSSSSQAARDDLPGLGLPAVEICQRTSSSMSGTGKISERTISAGKMSERTISAGKISEKTISGKSERSLEAQRASAISTCDDHAPNSDVIPRPSTPPLLPPTPPDTEPPPL
jgi:hypothetical protein